MKKFFTNVYSLLGFIFSIVGLCFLLTSIIVWINMDAVIASPNSRGDVTLLPIIFGIVGLVLFILSILFFIIYYKKQKKIAELIEHGNFVMAKVINISKNLAIEVNGRHPFYLECQYKDIYTGAYHIFKSENIFFYPEDMIGKEIRVYVDGSNYKNYYVDMDSILVYEN